MFFIIAPSGQAGRPDRRTSPSAPPYAAVVLLVLAAVLAVVLGAPPAARAQGPDDANAAYIRSHYTKYEERIPMRDGVKLFTAIYVPNDAGAGKTYPILFERTPYAVMPYGADQYRPVIGPSPAYERDGFIFVLQDVRGRFLSEGTFVNMRPESTPDPGETDESTDTYDTIDWLIHHVAGNNGKVGMWGISYPGFYAAAGAIHSHPALVAVSPQAPIADWFWDDMHHNGAFVLPLSFDFFSIFGQPRPEPTSERADFFDHGTQDGYDFFLGLGPLSNANTRYFHDQVAFWNAMTEHPNYDEFWQSRNILPNLQGVGAAVMTVGGWFDTEDLYGPLATYRAIERQNPGISNVLVMGPWPHGGWARSDGRKLGEADFGFETSAYYRDHVELPFFRHYLKGAEDPHLPEALVFETGANRWRRFDAWPPHGIEQRTLYLGGGHGLGFDPPADSAALAAPAAPDGMAETPPAADGSASAPDGGGMAGSPGSASPGEEASDAFVSDPSKPVPYTMEITTHWARDYMTEDQRFAAWRPDVLVYESEPLADDLTLAGPMTADLWVSTTGRDADWVVKVIDVFPEDEPRFVEKRPVPEDGDLRGVQRLVRAEVMRGRFRESFERPVPFEPGEVTRVSFELHDILHTFLRGHRLMVQVQSTWFPFIDRNPQGWVPNIFAASEADFIPATHRVYRSAEHPSGIHVGVLPREAEMSADGRGRPLLPLGEKSEAGN